MAETKQKMIKEEDKATHKSSCLWGILWMLLLLLIDQLTKIWADAYYVDVKGFTAPGVFNELVIIPGVIEFGLGIHYNRGIAFSSFSDAGVGLKMAIVIGTGVLMFLLAVFYFKTDKRRTWLRAALVLIVAGGLGNLIDRVMYQVWDPATNAILRDGVRDMVRVVFFMDFGVCNFADFFICGGAAVLFLALFFFDTDALFPLTKKYKGLAKEAEQLAEKKKLEEAKKIVEAAEGTEADASDRSGEE